MKINILTSVVLTSSNGDEHIRCDFKDFEQAVNYLDSNIRSDKFISGYIKLTIIKG